EFVLAEENTRLAGSTQTSRQGLKERTGCCVGGRDRRLEVAHVRTGGACENVFDHPPGKALATRAAANGHLPDEERLGIIRLEVARDKTAESAFRTGHNTRGVEVRGDQQIAVGAIDIERRAG